MTMRRAFTGRVLVAACAGGLIAASPFPPVAAQGSSLNAPLGQAGEASAPTRSLIEQYCLTCHSERLQTAGLSLAKVDPTRVVDHAAVWEKVVRRLRTGTMPPAGARRPAPETVQKFVSSIAADLDRASAANPDPGRTTLRRLNRSEYAHAVRDLLGVEVDGHALLPQDDSDLGFDNMADILSVSPALVDRYIAAARQVARMALGLDRNVGEATYVVPKFRFQDARMSDDLPFGSRGGLAVSHHFPFDGEYVIKVRLVRQLYEYIRGLDEPQQIDIRVDGRRIKLLTVGGEAPGRPAPLTFAGEIRTDEAWEQYWLKADEGLEARVTTTAGVHKVSVSFVERPWELDGPLQPTDSRRRFSIDQNTSSYSGKSEAALHTIAIAPVSDARGIDRTGPGTVRLSPATAQKLLVTEVGRMKDERARATKIVGTLARRAFRRPVSDQDLAPLMKYYASGRQDGDFWSAISRVIEYVLVDPEFLFRLEPDPANVPPGTVYRLGDVPLASRLSFFLWSSIPDDELLDVAERGRLSDPVVLAQQVKRMLRDDRARAFVDNFFGQWLTQRSLASVTPVPEFFPEFDENLRDAFLRETQLFVNSQLRDDRPLIEMVTANYAYVNERLARHYGIANVYGSRFRRVMLSTDTRGGILGQGSILTVSSYAHRTSPVIRGKWLLDNMLGTPAPPPPPNVPNLPETTEHGKSVSVRARLEQHRKNPVCATCHSRMDPLGFALENFDAIGAWRDVEGSSPIDASGALVDGTRISGFAGLRQILAARQDDFATAVAEKLMTYALGRGLQHSDMPAVRAVTQEAAKENYRWSSMILGVVRSMPFQYGRSAS